MSAKTKETGGGAATGLSNDFIKWLQSAVTTGQFGAGTATTGFNNANPMGDTMGMATVLNDILSGGAGVLGGNMNKMISENTENQAAALRSRYGAGGGMSMGTPAAYGEAMLRSQSGAQQINAIGGLQMQALLPMLQIIAGMSQQGIAQRQTVVEPNPWMQGLQAASGGVQAGAQVYGAVK